MQIIGDDITPTRYKWPEYTDGQTRLAMPGEDFTGTPQQFQNAGRRWAERNDYVWRSTQVRGGVAFSIKTE